MKAQIILKSGHVIEVECDTVTWRADRGTTALTAWNVQGMKKGKMNPSYIDVNEIAAILTTGASA